MANLCMRAPNIRVVVGIQRHNNLDVAISSWSHLVSVPLLPGPNHQEDKHCKSEYPHKKPSQLWKFDISSVQNWYDFSLIPGG